MVISLINYESYSYRSLRKELRKVPNTTGFLVRTIFHNSTVVVPLCSNYFIFLFRTILTSLFLEVMVILITLGLSRFESLSYFVMTEIRSTTHPCRYYMLSTVVKHPTK